MTPGLDPGPAPELTARALLSGVLIAGVLGVANVYMGLKTGWTDSGNVSAAIVGFALMSIAGRRRASAGELNTVQSTATMAAAVGFTSGIGAAIPALAMLGHSYSPWAIAVWAAGLSLLGLAIAFARSARLLELELPFPTSVAMRQLVTAIERATKSGLTRARDLGLAVVASGAVTWFRDGRPSCIPSVLSLPGSIGGVSARSLTLGIGLNPMFLGGGALLGIRISLSVVIGGVLGYALLGPRLIAAGLVAGADFPSLLSWLMWPGVGLLLSSTLTSFAFDVVALLRRRGGRAPGGTLERGPTLLGAAGVVLIVAVGHATFGLSAILVLVVIAVSLPLTEAAMRAYGETDIAPIGPTGQLVQIASASTVARAATGNLPLGNIATGLSSHATASLLALKIGQRLGATRRPQLIAQLVGTAVGIATAIPAYLLVTRAYSLGSRDIPAPGVMPWKAVAESVGHGIAVMPHGAARAALAGLIVGVILTLLARSPRLARLLPSPTAMGLGLLVPQYYSTTMLLGAVAGAVAHKRAPAWAQQSLEAIAGGLIIGESLLGVALAALIVLGVLHS